MHTLKLDSKGRLLIPFYFRRTLHLNEGANFKIHINDSGEITLAPIGNGESVKLKAVVKHDKLCDVAKVIENNDINISNSSSFKISDKYIEFSATLSNADIKKIKTLEESIGKFSSKITIESLHNYD